MKKATAHVLVVDDNEAFAEALRRTLVKLGFAASTAHSAAEAGELLAARRPDVILLDLRMPEINGHVFLRDLNRQFVDVPVIVISGEGGMNDVILAMRNQAADYLQKPFKADELSRALDRVLRGPATGGSQAGEGDLATSPRSASTQSDDPTRT